MFDVDDKKYSEKKLFEKIKKKETNKSETELSYNNNSQT